MLNMSQCLCHILPKQARPLYSHLCFLMFEELVGAHEVGDGDLDLGEGEAVGDAAPGTRAEREPVVRAVPSLLLRREAVRVKPARIRI